MCTTRPGAAITPDWSALGGLKHPPRRQSWSSGIRFDSQSIVHCNPELLLAPKVALGRLDRDVAEQKLDLIRFAAGEVAETGAGAPQVVRGQLVDPCASRRRAPFTRRIPATSSGLKRPASAASYAMRRTAASRTLMVAGAYPRCSR
jgi:hypothetical protein